MLAKGCVESSCPADSTAKNLNKTLNGGFGRLFSRPLASGSALSERYTHTMTCQFCIS